MPRDVAHDLRHQIDALTYADPDAVLAGLIDTAALSAEDRPAISAPVQRPV